LISGIVLFGACAKRGSVQPRQWNNSGKWTKATTSHRSARGVSHRSYSPKRDSYNASRPEPYSIESGQSDPEVLGPQ